MRFNKTDIGVIVENKEKYICFNVKINVRLAGVKYKDGISDQDYEHAQQV